MVPTRLGSRYTRPQMILVAGYWSDNFGEIVLQESNG